MSDVADKIKFYIEAVKTNFKGNLKEVIFNG